MKHAPPASDAEKYDRRMRTEAPKDVQALEWHGPQEAPFRLAGFAWFNQDHVYRRLPVHPPAPLPEPVYNLANATAGGQVHLRTDSTRVVVRVKLRGPAAMNHMPATGQCGFDAYLGKPGALRYAGTARPPLHADAFESDVLPGGLLPGRVRNVVVNFPLYEGVNSLELGVYPGSRLLAPPPYAREGRVIVYGTSITQGGCASRPGMAFTNILSRRLNVEFINLGFSGRGKGEPEVARAIAAIADPILYVLDYEGNAGFDGLKATLENFIDILRAAQNRIPLLIMSRPPSLGSLYVASKAREAAAARDFQRRTVAQRRRRGDRHIHFLDGRGMLGRDWYETTVDGAHPTDLGFYRIAAAMEPMFRRLLRAG